MTSRYAQEIAANLERAEKSIQAATVHVSQQDADKAIKAAVSFLHATRRLLQGTQ
jgi:hypothetical protein